MNEQAFIALYNRLNLQNKVDFNTFKNDFINNPAARQAAYNKAGFSGKVAYNTFESDLLGTNKNLNQTPTQQPVKPVVSKPVTSKPQEETGWKQKFSNFMSNLFGSDDLPLKVDNNLTENKVDLKNIKEPIAPNIKQTEFSQTGYDPGETGLSKYNSTKNQFKAQKDKIFVDYMLPIIEAKQKNDLTTAQKLEKERDLKLQNFDLYAKQELNKIKPITNNKNTVANFVDKETYYNNLISEETKKYDQSIIDSYKAGLVEQGKKLETQKINKINKLKQQKQIELNTLKSKSDFEGEIVDEFTKKVNSETIKKNLITEKNKLNNIKAKNWKEFIPENPDQSLFSKIVEEANPFKGFIDVYKGTSIKEAKVKDLENKINRGKQDLKFLNNYNIDIKQSIKNLPQNKMLQLEMALDPELKGFAVSANEYAGRKDYSNIRNILSNPFTSKDVSIKNLTSETNEKNFLEKLTKNAKDRADFYSADAKDKLQEQLVKSKINDVFNVDSPEFNQLIDNYDKIAQNPSLISQIYKNKNPQELLQKLQVLNRNPQFKEIIDNEIYFNTINNERVGNNLKQFVKEKKDNLQALNYLEQLGKTQQLKEDYIEQKAKEEGIFSMANAKFIGTQALEGIDFVGLTGKSFLGTIAGAATGDKYETTRQLQAGAETFKAINFAQDESELSPYATSKWVVIPVKGGSNYQIAVDDQGNFLTARSHDLSYPVNDPKKLEELKNYFDQNKDTLLKNTKNLSDIDGGYSAMAGYTGSKVGQGVLEEVPSMGLEVGLTYLSRGASGALVASRLAKWGDKLLDINKAKENYDKIASVAINGLSTYAEIGYGVRKDYEEQGLNPEFYNTLITSGALTAVAQLTPALENTYQELGNALASKEIRQEAKNLLVRDMPEVIKMLSDATVNITDKRTRDFIFNKELRNYAVTRLGEISGNIAKKFGREGVQEAAEETIFEPIAQVFANAANASLSGNDLYNKQTLQDLGFLDPETALIAGLTGGIMAGGIGSVTDLISSKENAFNSIDNLQAAVNNPDKFKSFLSTYLNNKDTSGKNLTQEQLDNVISNFDTITNNYKQTKESYGFNEDFISKFNFNDPAQQQLFNTIGLNQDNIVNFNGTKTLNNLILENEVNKIKGAQVSSELTNSIGEEINGQKTLQPFLNENGFIDITKLRQKDLDQETTDLIRSYNTNVAKNLKLNNTLNLFTENFGAVQDQFINNYQQTLLNNPDLTSPELGLYDSLYQDKLFNKLLNNKRIDSINKALLIGQGLTKDAELKKELEELNNANKELDKTLDYIKDTFKEGFLDTQNEINSLSEEFEMLDFIVNKHLDDYFKGSIDNFLDLEENDLNTLNEQASQQLAEVIKKKEQKLKDLKKAYNNANKKYNNGIVAPLLSNNNISNLEQSIKKDKDVLQKIKDYRKIYTKLRKSKINLNELLRLKNNNMSYDEEIVKTKVLPYYLNFTKDELDFAFNQDPDLLLAFYSVLEDLDYLPELENYKKNYFSRTEENIDLNYLSAVVQDAILALSYNVALVNAGKADEIYLEKDKVGAILALNLMQGAQAEIEENVETEEDSVPPVIPEINVTDKQQETIDLINKHTLPKSEFEEGEITSTHYIINGEKYKRVTSVETKPIETKPVLVAGGNVGNFFDNLGRIIFANNQITEKDAITTGIELANIFQSQGVIIKLDKDNFIDIVKKLVKERDKLVSKGYIFISDEKVLYSRYDGVDFNNSLFDSVGIAGTMDIIAIAPNGSIDIIDLKTISNNKGKANENSANKEQSSWAQQLGFYKTMLEKIPGRKVNSLSVLRSKVIYNLDQTGNIITKLNFTSLDPVTITVSNTILKTINKYLSVPNYIPEPESEQIISDNLIIEESEEISDISDIPSLALEETTEEEITEINSGVIDTTILISESEEVPEITEDDYIFVDEDAGVYETMEDLDPNLTPVTIEEADRIFGTTDVEENTILRTDLEINLNNNERGSKNFSEKDNTIWVSADPRVVFKRLFREKGIRTNSPIVLSNVRTINNQKIYEFYRQNPDATNDQGFIGFSFILNKDLDLTDAQIKEITNLAQSIIDRFTIENGKVKYYSSMGEEQRNNIREEFANGILNIINNKQALESKQTPLQPTEESKQESLQTNLSTPIEFNSEKQIPVNIDNTEKDEIQEEAEIIKDGKPSNPNISSLSRYSYIRFESIGDKFKVFVDNNFNLNDKFKNKIFTFEELQEAFKKEGLFFPTKFKTYEKIGNKNVYIARNQSDNSPIPSFIQNNVLNTQPLAYDAINNINSQDFVGQSGQVIVLDTTDNYNNKLSEADFLNKASLGIVVNNQLVSIIPTNHPVRKQLKLVKQGNSFNIEPFNIKIDKVKKGSILFNSKIKTDVSQVINEAKNLGFTTSSIAYVGVEKDQLVFKTKDENNNDIVSKVSVTPNTKKGSVFLLLQNDKKEIVKIPLKTPKFKEFLASKYTEEEIQTITQIFVNALSQINLQGKTVEEKYENFINNLKNNPSNIIKQILNTIPQDIGNVKFFTPNQKTKYNKLDVNFTPENLFEYLSETLITLNNDTKRFYTADVDLENFYADNSVVISYSQTNNIQETKLEDSSINPDLNRFNNISQDFEDLC